LVAIVSAGTAFRGELKAVEFRDWLDATGAEVFDLEKNVFRPENPEATLAPKPDRNRQKRRKEERRANAFRLTRLAPPGSPVWRRLKPSCGRGFLSGLSAPLPRTPLLRANRSVSKLCLS
jgi:hypothetical protein